MSKIYLIIALLIFPLAAQLSAYTANGSLQPGDTHLATFLIDLEGPKISLYFPGEQDLKDWLLENRNNQAYSGIQVGRIVDELEFRIEPGLIDVTITEQPEYPPYFITYEWTNDAGETWETRCEWTSLVAAQKVIENILADPDNKRLTNIPPLEVLGLSFEFEEGPGSVVIFKN
ncbi:hypothetical protein N8Z76_00360 [Gammaproteobacteria bacterium]|nr:hypothetical protein [Gammaproteobacteria bacterium]